MTPSLQLVELRAILRRSCKGLGLVTSNINGFLAHILILVLYRPVQSNYKGWLVARGAEWPHADGISGPAWTLSIFRACR